ncbi:hypothetical protein PSOL_06570 [Candidatus Phytoplasma solani]
MFNNDIKFVIDISKTKAYLEEIKIFLKSIFLSSMLDPL